MDQMEKKQSNTSSTSTNDAQNGSDSVLASSSREINDRLEQNLNRQKYARHVFDLALKRLRCMHEEFCRKVQRQIEMFPTLKNMKNRYLVQKQQKIINPSADFDPIWLMKFQQSIEEQIINHSKVFNEFQSRIVQKFNDYSLLVFSEVISSKKQQDQIRKYFQLQNQNVKDFQLVFRASDYDFSSQQFHRICDDKVNTLTILKNDKKEILGGFTSKAWDSSDKFTDKLIEDDSGTSFIFNLTKDRKSTQIRQKYIYYDPSYGPSFELNPSQMNIFTNCDKNSVSNFYIYQPNQGKKIEQEQNSQRCFSVVEYEVYRVVFFQDNE